MAGLREHWGEDFDPTQNPDLDDIGAFYAGSVFLVALLGERLVGTGALLPERPGVGRIVRMSVSSELRRQGIGRQLLNALCDRAKECGYHKIVLETTSTWEDALAFYRQAGFEVVGMWDGDTHFEYQISNISNGRTFMSYQKKLPYLLFILTLITLTLACGQAETSATPDDPTQRRQRPPPLTGRLSSPSSRERSPRRRMFTRPNR